MKYYLIGIKGTGMSALAMYLQDLGHSVEGSDDAKYYFTEKLLRQRNIPIYSFNEDNIDGRNIYIISYGQINNIETKKVLKNEYHHYYYNQFIGLIPSKDFIGISGTHGKTTTSKLLAHFLKNKDVSYIIGSGEGYGSIKSKELIVEACEYQEHFLMYYPKVLIINNIEEDHPDFFKSIKEVRCAFQKIANQSEIVIANGDDKNILKLKHPKIIYYGFNKNNNIICKIIEKNKTSYKIEITTPKQTFNYTLPFTGLHMIYNFLACFTYLYLFEYNTYLSQVEYNCTTFGYPQRRNNLSYFNNCLIVDDYAHHPTEIKALYASLKQAYPKHQINVIFQPHTYTRTIKYQKEFVTALSLFDKVYLDKTFTSKREKYNLAQERKITKIFKCFLKFEENIIETIKEDIRSNTMIIWIFLGAGTINDYYDNLIKELNKTKM